MVHYKLIYFDGRGLGELIRQIFVVSDQNYEDVRYSFEEWPKHKDGKFFSNIPPYMNRQARKRLVIVFPEMPFGQIPVLEVDGKQLAQSFAIARYLSRKFGLAGKNEFEEALVDSIADQYKDYMHEIYPFVRVHLGFDQGDLEKLKDEHFLPAQRKFFGFMTKFLEENKSGYLVGDSLTFVDLCLAEHVAEYAKNYPMIHDGFPEMKAHAEMIRSIPALKKWIETRPVTKF